MNLETGKTVVKQARVQRVARGKVPYLPGPLSTRWGGDGGGDDLPSTRHGQPHPGPNMAGRISLFYPLSAPEPTKRGDQGDQNDSLPFPHVEGWGRGTEDSAPPRPQRRLVVTIWIGWYITLLLFQQIVWARFTLQRPDYAYPWTGDMTSAYADGPDTGPWFYARWDSPRYVTIARDGYTESRLAPHFPLYPLLMRMTYEALIRPFGGLAMEDGLALAGMIVSGGMSLLAALLLYALAWDWLGPDDALRAVFYLLIFPTALYMAQVYSEATYLAVSLAALLLTFRRRWLPAVILIVLATLTRTMGVLLVIPYLFTWFSEWWNGRRPPRPALIGAILPPLVFALWVGWLASRGLSLFDAQESFGREILTFNALLIFLGDVAYIFRAPNGIHVAGDLTLTILAVWLCLREFKHFPGMALYGLGSVGMAISSGQLVSMSRYALAVIPIYFALARRGRRPAFDRVWTVISLLWFGLYVVLFVHGFWLG